MSNHMGHGVQRVICFSREELSGTHMRRSVGGVHLLRQIRENLKQVLLKSFFYKIYFKFKYFVGRSEI